VAFMVRGFVAIFLPPSLFSDLPFSCPSFRLTRPDLAYGTLRRVSNPKRDAPDASCFLGPPFCCGPHFRF